MPASLRFYLFVGLNSLLLLLPPLLNGGPFIYYDTAGYAINAAHFLSPLAQGASAADPWWEGEIVSLSRSPVYGLAVFAARYHGLYWGLILAQAIATGWIVTMLFRQALQDRFGLPSLATSAAMVLLTPLGTLVGLPMPDLWVGLGVAAIALLSVYWTGLSWPARLLALAILVFSAASHNSHLLLYLVLALLGGALRLLPGPGRKLSGAGLTGVALSVAAAGILVTAMYSTITGFTQTAGRRLPHLTAHLIDYGPGADFVAEQCPEAGFEICDYADLVPYEWGAFMFDLDARISAASFQRMGDEDSAFLLAVLKSYPLQTVTRLARDGALQLVTLTPDEMVMSSATPPAKISNLRDIEESFVRNGVFFAHPELFRVVELAAWTAMLGSLAALSWMASRGAATELDPRLVLAVGICLAGVVLNGLICGSVASPYGRFQIRIIWLLPLAAGLALTAFARHEARGRAAERLGGGFRLN